MISDLSNKLTDVINPVSTWSFIIEFICISGYNFKLGAEWRIHFHLVNFWAVRLTVGVLASLGNDDQPCCIPATPKSALLLHIGSIRGFSLEANFRKPDGFELTSHCPLQRSEIGNWKYFRTFIT